MSTQETNLVTLRDKFACQRMATEDDPTNAYEYADKAIMAREKNLSHIASYSIQKLIGEITFMSITNQNERLIIKIETSSNRFSIDVLDTTKEKANSLFNQVIHFNDETAIDQLVNVIAIVRKIAFPQQKA